MLTKKNPRYQNALLRDFDHVFWAGDMNYRINGTRQVVDVLLEKSLHEIMINNDQLTLSMKFKYVASERDCSNTRAGRRSLRVEVAVLQQ